MTTQTVSASVIYLKKEDYGGPYLHPNGPRGQNARRFWNFALRRLLEWHFDANPLVSDRYDLVLDRIEMSRSQQAEIEGYLSRNLRIPAPINVTLASSLYVEALQVVHHIANAYGTEILSGTTHDSLRVVRALDITADYATQSETGRRLKKRRGRDKARFSGSSPDPLQYLL